MGRTTKATDDVRTYRHDRVSIARNHWTAPAPTQQYGVVVFEGEHYPTEVDDTRSVTVETYRYEASQVVPNASGYTDQLRREYASRLSNLTDTERSVVRKAVVS